MDLPETENAVRLLHQHKNDNEVPGDHVELPLDKVNIDIMTSEADENGYTDISPQMGKPRHFVYKVSENPPLIWAILFGIQQGLISISSPLAVTLIVSEVACFQEDTSLKLQILSAVFFMIGIATFSVSTFGVRLPIFQGPSMTAILPLLALQSLEEWKCPTTFQAVDVATNVTTLMADMGNGTVIPYREQALQKIAILSGSLCVAGAIHFLVGFSGAVGFLIRFIGPVTIIPTITTVALQLYHVVARLCEPDWTMAIAIIALNLILSFYLGKRKTPIPMWTSRKGFHIHWYPLHNVLSIFISIIIGYIVSTILTHAGVYPDDSSSKHFLARTDASGSVVQESDWFRIPYPGQFGSFSFRTGIFVNFLVASILSIIDSIGDYAACARVARVTPPPPFAFNRGLAVEGLMTVIGGLLGCCHPTVSYGEAIGAMNITKVASRRVFQMTGLMFAFLGIFTKFGSLVISVPNPLLGGMMVIAIGMFVGIVLSNIQNLDLNSSRNLAIIGSTLLVGLVVPHYIKKNPNAIETGYKDLDDIIKMLLSNHSFVAGIYSCFLDNTMPGTQSERGLASQEKELHGEVSKSNDYEDGPEVYRLPFLPRSFRKSPVAKFIPLFDVTNDVIGE